MSGRVAPAQVTLPRYEFKPTSKEHPAVGTPLDVRSTRALFAFFHRAVPHTHSPHLHVWPVGQRVSLRHLTTPSPRARLSLTERFLSRRVCCSLS